MLSRATRFHGLRPPFENVIDHVYGISQIGRVTAIGVSGAKRIGRRAAFEDIVDDVHGIRNVNGTTGVGIVGKAKKNTRSLVPVCVNA